MVWGAEMGRANEIPVKLTCCFPKNVWEPSLAVPLPWCCEFVLEWGQKAQVSPEQSDSGFTLIFSVQVRIA